MTQETLELITWIDNDARSYGRLAAAYRNLDRHRRQGRFDADKALILMTHVAKDAAKAYHEEFGTPGDRWYDLFDTDCRRIAGRHLLANYLSFVEDDEMWWVE